MLCLFVIRLIGSWVVDIVRKQKKRYVLLLTCVSTLIFSSKVNQLGELMLLRCMTRSMCRIVVVNMSKCMQYDPPSPTGFSSRTLVRSRSQSLSTAQVESSLHICSSKHGRDLYNSSHLGMKQSFENSH